MLSKIVGIETVSCRLMQRNGKDVLKLENMGSTFSRFNANYIANSYNG